MIANDPSDDLKDQPLSDEIALLGELMLAAGEAGAPLSEAQVDSALGVQRRTPGTA